MEREDLKISPQGVKMLGDIASSFGWTMKSDSVGYELTREIDGVNCPAYISIYADDLADGKTLPEIIAESIGTFHTVGAACELALYPGSSNLYQYEEIIAAKKLKEYLDLTITVKEEMLKILKAVRDQKIELVLKDNKE